VCGVFTSASLLVLGLIIFYLVYLLFVIVWLKQLIAWKDMSPK